MLCWIIPIDSAILILDCLVLRRFRSVRGRNRCCGCRQRVRGCWVIEPRHIVLVVSKMGSMGCSVLRDGG